MPTECERSIAMPHEGQQQHQQQQQQLLQAQQQIQEQQMENSLNASMESNNSRDELNGDMSTSQTSTTSTSSTTPPTTIATTNGHNGNNNNNNGSNGTGGARKTSITSPDPTAYVAKARVTRPTPPPPSYNPMQFVQIKPCNLYQTAQQQLKKAEEVKKIKEIKKEEPEDWQNNLDNWKSSRRKRVEHIIDRVVEVKKLELEEHDRTRRKSKTLSEMIEERGDRGARGRVKLASLAVYNEDESNDLSDLGIGTSSASGKSSLSEDYDNNSVMSDNPELEKPIFEHNSNNKEHSTTREYISSPGYDTSSSTAPASSPDPCEYTYEGAIQDYKQRVSRATSGGGIAANYLNNSNAKAQQHATSKESTPERLNNSNGQSDIYPTRRGSKIEDRLIGFEVTSPSDSQEVADKQKVDVPKIDISKRKEMFEMANASAGNESKPFSGSNGNSNAPRVTLRERFTTADSDTIVPEQAKKDVKRLSGDITSIRDRLQSLEQQQNLVNNTANGATKSTPPKLVDIPVPPLKDRLSSLQNAVTKEEVKKPPVVLIDARQLEIMKNEEATAQQRLKQLETTQIVAQPAPNATAVPTVKEEEIVGAATMDRDDSGILTSDDIEADAAQLESEQEQQLNAAIAALALEEKQLEEAANAVNQIEAEFAEHSSTANVTAAKMPAAIVSATNEPQCDMEISINEALELALAAIDKETKPAKDNKAAANDFDADDNAKYDDDDEIENTQNVVDVNVVVMHTKHIHNHNNDNDNDDNNVDNNENNPNPNQQRNKQNKQKINATNINAANIKNNHKEIVKQGNDDATTTNKTDEEKELQEAEIDELKISNEPIYENVKKDVEIEIANEIELETRIIPNMNMTISNNNNNKSNSKIQKVNTNKNNNNLISLTNAFANNNNNNNNNTTTTTATKNVKNTLVTTTTATNDLQQQQQLTSLPITTTTMTAIEPEPYYQVPKSSEPYYDAPKHLRPIPVYENIEIFYTGLENSTLSIATTHATVGVGGAFKMEPPKEKPPPPPTESPPLFDDVDSVDNGDTWSSDNTYETISSRLPQNALAVEHPSPPIKRMNSTKRIKKELRNKRSSFLGIEAGLDDDESYLELTVAPPPDMAQLLQEERRLEKQLYMKAGLCDSSDTGESRDSGVSENHSRQSSEHYTNSSEENDRHIDSPPHSLKTNEVLYQNDALHCAQTPLLQTVKGNSAESWTESATAAAAATKSLTEATATANAKMLSIEEKIREQEEVLRVERELLQLEQEELKRQRENLMLRENMARRELQHGAKMLMSANRRSLQDLNGVGMSMAVAGYEQTLAMPQTQLQLPPVQQIYANLPNLQQQQQQQQQLYYQHAETDYRKSMSDLNEFSKRLILPPTPPTKPMRAMHVATHELDELSARQRHSLNAQSYGGSLVKIAAPAPTAAPRGGAHNYANYQQQQQQQQSTQNLTNGHAAPQHGQMTRNTLHALSATPKPKYTDGWVQVQNRKTFDTNLANDPAWLSAYQQKRKSMPDAYHAYNNHWLVQEAEQRRVIEQQRRSISNGNTPVHQQNGGANVHFLKAPLATTTPTTTSTSNSNGKPLPDSIIQTLTERVQSKGIGERKRFDNYHNNNNNNVDKSPLHAAAAYHQQQQAFQNGHRHHHQTSTTVAIAKHNNNNNNSATTAITTAAQDKVLSVSGKKKCSHCGDELGRGAAMIIESLLLFYHINCFKCCVCHVQLGDGLNGTDVRVRNHKLHCQNCYSSDDGIKFSCV